MVIKEAQRTFTYLNLYGYFTDLIVCNRMIPDTVDDRYFAAWKESQEKYYHMIEDGFSPVPILKLPLFQQEVVGLPILTQVANTLFSSDDPSKIFFHGQAQEITRENKHYVLTLNLPFATKDRISLTKNGSELVVNVGSQRRNIILPNLLVGMAPQEAKFEDNKLKIQFEAIAGAKN